MRIRTMATAAQQARWRARKRVRDLRDKYLRIAEKHWRTYAAWKFGKSADALAELDASGPFAAVLNEAFASIGTKHPYRPAELHEKLLDVVRKLDGADDEEIEDLQDAFKEARP
jgi:hypothetical protein